MIIVDLDGTLCDNTHRQGLMPPKELVGTTEAWAPFNKACIDDRPIGPMVELLTTLKFWHDSHEVIFVTGRGYQSYDETMQWLDDNITWFRRDAVSVIMRPEDEVRFSADFKYDVFKRLGLSKNDIVLEDDPKIIEMVHKNFGSIVVTPPTLCSSVLRDNQK